MAVEPNRLAAATVKQSATVANEGEDGPKVARSRNNVMVGCKLPNGAHLRLHTKQTMIVPGGNNTMIETSLFVVDQEAPSITLPGIARGAKGEGAKALIIDGATITAVDSDFMHAWMDQNKKHPWITGGMIFIGETRDEAEGQAKDRVAFKSGQEPLMPVGDPRARGNRHAVTPATAT